MDLHHIQYLLDIPVILLSLTSILSILWSHAILPKFLIRNFLQLLWCLLLFFIMTHVYETLVLRQPHGGFPLFTVYKAVIAVLCCITSISLMEIIFYFMDIKRPLPLFFRLLSISSVSFVPFIFLLPIPRIFHFVVLGILASELWFSAIFMFFGKTKGEALKISDPGVLLMRNTIIPLLLLIPFQFLEVMLWNQNYISRFTLLAGSLFSSLIILRQTIPFHRSRMRGSEVSHIGISDKFAETYQLSPREKEILAILMDGKSHREIGEELCISPRTVDTHVHNIYKKCQVSSWKELYTLLAGNS